MDSKPSLAPSLMVVVAGVIFERREGRSVVLVTQRKAGAHLEGLWELPGGKVDPDEDPRAALARELDEELGIAVTVGAPLEVTSHVYREELPAKHVLLLFFEAARLPSSAEPRALDVADFRWADLAALDALEFPAADVAVVAVIKERLRSSPGPSAPLTSSG